MKSSGLMNIYNEFLNFFKKYKKNKAALLGLGIVVFFALTAITAPLISPYDPYDMKLKEKLTPPNSEHLMGTDRFGRDQLSGIIWGTRTSLFVGIISGTIAIAIGLPLGCIAGYMGGRVDEIIMRIVDVFLVIPSFFLILVIVAVFGSGIENVMIVMGLTMWPSTCRLIRGQFLSMKTSSFVEAAQVAGASTFNIIFRQILPNVIFVAIVNGSFQISGSIMTEASLSFLGLGDPNNISWGYMLNGARKDFYVSWWTSLFPGIMILLSTLAFNSIGDGLNDALNPALKER
jgi:peptide/nickel transport system permease protein